MQYHIFSPYRICPVGAHSDHQHGIVTGFAIDKGVDLYFDISDNSQVILESSNYKGTICFDLNEPSLIKQKDWGDYARGAKYALRKRFTLKRGIKGRISGSLPVGGLSSSAAVLIAYVMAFAKANDIHLTPLEVAKIASEAEREYVGLDNGLLDQACIALGKKDHLLMFDCNDLNYRLIQPNERMLPFEFAIFFSGLTRSLVSSDFNLRVSECRTAAWNLLAYEGILLKDLNKTYLRDVPIDIYYRHKDRMPARFARRAEHFYTEYKRVRQAVTAWETGSLEWLGALSFESCESSRNNWECGSMKLNAIYQIMRRTDGIYGGRFSGAGFKGACIALVDPAKKDAIKEKVTAEYLSQFPEYRNTFEVHFVHSDDGARFIED